MPEPLTGIDWEGLEPLGALPPTRLFWALAVLRGRGLGADGGAAGRDRAVAGAGGGGGRAAAAGADHPPALEGEGGPGSPSRGGGAGAVLRPDRLVSPVAAILHPPPPAEGSGGGKAPGCRAVRKRSGEHPDLGPGAKHCGSCKKTHPKRGCGRWHLLAPWLPPPPALQGLVDALGTPQPLGDPPTPWGPHSGVT